MSKQAPEFEWGVKPKVSPHPINPPPRTSPISELMDKVDSLEFELRAIRKRLTEMENKWNHKKK